MGIYISGVKGLPEQVQENKNKIKEVEEQIEGIDFDAIRELQGQVAENTQDINNLEASIGVQNQAINTLNNDVDALESKTQKITYDEDADEIHIASDVIMEEDLNVDNVHVAGNGTFQNANGSGLHFQEGVSDDEVVLSNKESGTAHNLTLHSDGTLTLDEQPVGGSKHMHNVMLYITGTFNCNLIINIDDDTPFTYDTLRQWLYDNNFRTSANRGGYPISGTIYDGAVDRNVCMIIAANLTNPMQIYYVQNGQLQISNFNTNGNVKDIVQ